MEKSRRWLWPASDSQFLRHENYRNVSYEAISYRSSDLLLPRSETEVDADARRAKRRKITALANSYLAGRPLFIASASLRGPFSGTEEQTYANKPPKPAASLVTSRKRSEGKVKEQNAAEFVLKRRAKQVRMDVDEDIPTPSPTTVMQDLRRERLAKGVRSIRPQRDLAMAERQYREEMPRSDTLPREPTSMASADEALARYVPHVQAVPANQESENDVEFETAKEDLQPVPASDNLHSTEAKPDQDMELGCKDKMDVEDVHEETQRASFTSSGLPTPPSKHSPSFSVPPQKYCQLSDVHADDMPKELIFGIQSARVLSQQAASRSAAEAGLEQARILSREAVTRLSQRNEASPGDALPPVPGFTPINRIALQEVEGNTPRRTALPASRMCAGVAVESGVETASATGVRQRNNVSNDLRPQMSPPKLAPASRALLEQTAVNSEHAALDKSLATLYNAVLNEKSSPFLFRKTKRHSEEDDTDVCRSPAPQLKRRFVAFDSSNANAETTVGPETAAVEPQEAPAINLSFPRESFGVNFDLIEQYTNMKLPQQSETDNGSTVVKQLKRAMRESGATILHPTSIPTSPRDVASPKLSRMVDQDVDESGAASSNTPDNTTDVNAVDMTPRALPEVSTQAALEEAHLALVNTVRKGRVDTDRSSNKGTPELEAPRKSVITPFAEFNKDLASNDVRSRDSSQEPVISTQAIFDAFSPFQLSTAKKATKSRPKKRATFASRLSDDGEDEEMEDANKSDDMTIIPVAAEPKPMDHEDTVRNQPTLGSGGWSFDTLDRSPPKPSTHIDPQPDTAQHEVTQVARNQVTESLARLPDSVQPSKTSTPVSAKAPSLSDPGTEAQRTTPQMRSFSLSQIIDSVNENRFRSVDVGRLLTQEAPRSLQRSPDGQRSSLSRGQVLDWDAASAATTRQSSPDDADDATVDASGAQAEVAPPVAPDEDSFVPASPLRGLGHQGNRLALTQSSAATSRVLPEASAPTSTLRSALKASTTRSSFQEAQREDTEMMDLDASLDDIQRNVLGSSWDVEKAMREGITAR